MTIEAPLWLQAGTYPARVDRALVEVAVSEGVIDVAGGDLAVSERALGANMSVDVAAGAVAITGDSEPNQGRYLGRSTAMVNRTVAAADPNDPRIDLVIARVRDAAVAGTDNDWIIDVLTGTPAAAPAAPVVPADAVPLAEISVAANAASIVNANITDRRPQAVPALGNAAYEPARLWVPASQMTAVQGAPTLSPTFTDWPGWLLDRDADESVGTTLSGKPKSWRLSDIEAWWVKLGTGSGNVRWLLRNQQFSGGEALGAIGGGTLTTTAVGAGGVLTKTIIATGVGWDPDNVLNVRVSRLGSAAEDTYSGGDIALIGLAIKATP